MTQFLRGATRMRWGVALVVISAVPAPAAITSVTGGATARVLQFINGEAVQDDLGLEQIPETTPVPPAVARARIDRLLEGGEIVAAGQVVAILSRPNVSLDNPGDIGLDLGAFSDDGESRWFVEGEVVEKRRVVITPLEAGGGLTNGDATFFRSSVALSGVMLLTAEDATRDMTGVDAILRVTVTRRSGPEAEPQTVLTGRLVLAGGPDGTVEIAEASGAFSTVTLPIVDFENGLEGLPLVEAVVFSGVRLPYQYNATIGQPFELEVTVSAELNTLPGETGAAAVFGLPVEGIASILERVKLDDRGRRLAAMIDGEVDTTGAAYAAANAPSPLSGLLSSLCGTMGVETAGLLVGAVSAVWISGMRRRGRARRRGAYC